MPTKPREISRPTHDEYNSYYHQYISLFQAENFLDGFAAQTGELQQLLGDLSPEQVNQLHEPYTWTLKQVLGHLIDVERIFSTRALRIGVGDETPIPGIDQNIYVDGFDYNVASMKDLLDEFTFLRNANVMLAGRMSDKALSRRGTASENESLSKSELVHSGRARGLPLGNCQTATRNLVVETRIQILATGGAFNQRSA